jgi:hypothetical protein
MLTTLQVGGEYVYGGAWTGEIGHSWWRNVLVDIHDKDGGQV